MNRLTPYSTLVFLLSAVFIIITVYHSYHLHAIIPPPPPIGVPPPPIKPLPPAGPPLKPLPLSLNSGDPHAHPQHIVATFTLRDTNNNIRPTQPAPTTTPTPTPTPTTTITEIPPQLAAQIAQSAAIDASLEPIHRPFSISTPSPSPSTASQPSTASFTTMQFPPIGPAPGLGGPGLGGLGGIPGGGGFGGAGTGLGGNNGFGTTGGNNALLSSLDSALNTITQLLDRLNQGGSLNGGGVNPALVNANGQPVNIPISGSNGVSVGDSLANLQPINAATPNLPVPDF